MDPTISPAQVRQLVVHHFGHHGVDVQHDDMQERVRVSDGRRVAHCYRAGGLFAMWMVDVGLVQVYDQTGNMLDTLTLLNSGQQGRRAA